jgi:hypothetical protein
MEPNRASQGPEFRVSGESPLPTNPPKTETSKTNSGYTFKEFKSDVKEDWSKLVTDITKFGKTKFASLNKSNFHSQKIAFQAKYLSFRDNFRGKDATIGDRLIREMKEAGAELKKSLGFNSKTNTPPRKADKNDTESEASLSEEDHSFIENTSFAEEYTGTDETSSDATKPDVFAGFRGKALPRPEKLDVNENPPDTEAPTPPNSQMRSGAPLSKPAESGVEWEDEEELEVPEHGDIDVNFANEGEQAIKINVPTPKAVSSSIDFKNADISDIKSFITNTIDSGQKMSPRLRGQTVAVPRKNVEGKEIGKSPISLQAALSVVKRLKTEQDKLSQFPDSQDFKDISNILDKLQDWEWMQSLSSRYENSLGKELLKLTIDNTLLRQQNLQKTTTDGSGKFWEDDSQKEGKQLTVNATKIYESNQTEFVKRIKSQNPQIGEKIGQIINLRDELSILFS